MTFNSDTYRANKYRRDAWEGLSQAKDIKRRARDGNAYDWEVTRIPLIVKIARGDMHLSLIYRDLAEIRKRRGNAIF